MECPQLPPFGDDAYIDELSKRKKPLSPKVIEMMGKARAVDPFSRRVIDFSAFGLRLQDIGQTDFMVVIDDVQDIDWSRYEFLGRQPPLPTGSGRGRHQGRLIFCATEPGLRITTHRLVKSSKEPVYIFVDGPGTLAEPVGARQPPTGGKKRRRVGRIRQAGELTALSEQPDGK